MSRLIDILEAAEIIGSLAQTTRLTALQQLLAVYPASLPAGEIARLCDVPQNTMSSHLAVLGRAGLIVADRQGRTINYSANLKGFRSLVRFLARDCCGGRPELCGDFTTLVPDDVDNDEDDRMTPAFNVLFLCTHNSARSIMAEALLEKLGRGRFRAYSAGSDPASEPQREVVNRLMALGHDVSKLRCKSWDEFSGQDAPRMDFVIALCDTPEGQVCPDMGDKIVTGAWPLPDPASFTGSQTERTTLLNELYAMLRRRIEIFTSLPFESLDRMALKKRLDEIGDTAKVAP